MIHPNELRIGNYFVQIPDMIDLMQIPAKFIYLQVEEIYKAGKIKAVDQNNRTYILDSHEYIPILLGEKWLASLGFENLNSDYWQSEDNKYSIFCKDGSYMFFIRGTSDYGTAFLANIKYIHQLQNLYFAMIGEELELKQGISYE